MRTSVSNSPKFRRLSMAKTERMRGGPRIREAMEASHHVFEREEVLAFLARKGWRPFRSLPWERVRASLYKGTTILVCPKHQIQDKKTVPMIVVVQIIERKLKLREPTAEERAKVRLGYLRFRNAQLKERVERHARWKRQMADD